MPIGLKMEQTIWYLPQNYWQNCNMLAICSTIASEPYEQSHKCDRGKKGKICNGMRQYVWKLTLK